MIKDESYIAVLSKAIKDSYRRILDGREADLALAAKNFTDLGIIPDMHVGNEELKAAGSDSSAWTKGQKILALEWFAGALVAMHERQALYAVNSWINMASSYEESGII